jgi:hypothetical protein
MIRNTLPLVITLAFFIGAACSTAKVRVMPEEGGLNRVVVRDIQRDSAEEEAVDAAKDYCEKSKKSAVFVNGTGNQTKYTGSMDENTRNTIKKASTAAVLLGGVGMGPSDTRTAGGLLGSAGTVGHVMTNDRDYQTELQFKCQ